MPLWGTRDTVELLPHAPVMTSLQTEALDLPGVEILQLMYEIDSSTMEGLLPKALHPTIPATVTFLVWRMVNGPLGAFTLAQVRLGCRAGIRPRGFPIASYCDSLDPTEAFRSRWGYNCRPGAVTLRRYHDRAVGAVAVDGREVLKVELIDPQFISGADVQYTVNVNLALVERGGRQEPRLVQVDPEYTFRRAERGRPEITTFEPAAWNAEGVRPVYPVAATLALCDVQLPKLRYHSDPNVPAMQGTETVA